MQPIVLVITEKPSITKLVLSGIAEADLWPECQVLALETIYPLGHYQFSYHRGLRFSDVPVIREVEWRKREGMPFPRQLTSPEVVEAAALYPEQALRQAGKIVFACDPDVRGVTAFHILLRETLGAVVAERPHEALYLADLSSGALQAAILSRASTADVWYQQALAAGLCKRFFDFNFNLNAMILFGALLNAVGVQSLGPFVISKYGLQILYHLRGGVQTFSQLLRDMANWKGTGRYPPGQLGSPSSYAGILDQLTYAGLVEVTPRPAATIGISPAGAEFLSRLHPDCEDPDLPQRMTKWGVDWPASRPAVERYLRTFFGKQCRFSGRG